MRRWQSGATGAEMTVTLETAVTLVAPVPAARIRAVFRGSRLMLLARMTNSGADWEV